MVFGHHIILTGYGNWLPNDRRGSMSERIYAPDLEKLGTAHFGRKKVQPTLAELRAFYQQAQEHLYFPILWFDDAARQALGRAIGRFVADAGLTCYACSILSNHIHLLIRHHKLTCEQMLNGLRIAARTGLLERRFATSNHPVFSSDPCHMFKSSVPEMWACVRYIESNYDKHRIEPVLCDWVKTYDGWPRGAEERLTRISPNVKREAPNVNITDVNAKAPNVTLT